MENKDSNRQSVILFYKYGSLSSDEKHMEAYHGALYQLCSSLNLKGRILIGLSDKSEGINGTLAGTYSNVYLFTLALHGEQYYYDRFITKKCQHTSYDCVKSNHLLILQTFWKTCVEFAQKANIPVLTIDSPDDFKWSFPPPYSQLTDEKSSLFPDLKIQLVPEIINTGGKLSSITINDTSVGYLTPEEWHTSLMETKKKSDQNFVLIDCRNQKEYSIGHFDGALNPKTKTFEQFPRWVDNHKSELEGKKIYMYCTGGIRCEKASAYVRNVMASQHKDKCTNPNGTPNNDVSQVFHLKGGIHKYLEKYGTDGLFQGKNFVFDRRGADDPTANDHPGQDDNGIENKTAPNHSGSINHKIVGKCLYCKEQWDKFTADGICTVCREPTLVCNTCREKLKPKGEYHCEDHFHFKNCYFTDLSIFSSSDLSRQQQILRQLKEEISVGKKFKQKRKTIQKQIDKIENQLHSLAQMEGNNKICEPVRLAKGSKCRSCEEYSCNGTCWGFHGLGRKQKTEQNEIKKALNILQSNGKQEKNRQRPSANQRESKLKQKFHEISEIERLKLSLPSSSYRDPMICIRCPPPCTRVLQTAVKGKWFGLNALEVLKREFVALSDEKYLKRLLERFLIRINDIPMKLSENSFASKKCLKNMDVIGRVVHWHEPPVLVPSVISVQKISLPQSIRDAFIPNATMLKEEDYTIYCCNKPSTVPTHPAGPYLSNTLTLMVEAQESLQPRSLLPCHRLDRVTSGLILCCTSPHVARLLQTRISIGDISKLYLAKVQGNFSKLGLDCHDARSLSNANDELSKTWKRCEQSDTVEVDAPIHTLDPSKGIRTVNFTLGKESRSRFKFISYDISSDTSLIACYPITGRGHQLRVHLQWIGFPIYNDVQYGGCKCEDHGGQDEWKDMVLKSMMNSFSEEKHDCVNEADKINENDAKNARIVCRCCSEGKDGIEASFTPAQLLQGGHSIALHALKYCITFERKPKKRKRKCTKDAQDSAVEFVSKLTFSVEKPDWANIVDDIEVPWIKADD